MALVQSARRPLRESPRAPLDERWQGAAPAPLSSASPVDGFPEGPEAIEEQLLALDPDAHLPPGLDRLSPDRAAALIAGGGY